MPRSEGFTATLSGILNVAKPTGMTSHDVVGLIRRRVGIRRVGHAGTLDPAAAGVLVVCLGQATRVSEFLMETTKRYRATVRFGAVSTTDDSEGIITPSSASVGALDETLLQKALSHFIGDIEQIPPSFAAIKVRGQPMYRAARAGIPITAPPRHVRIDRIDIVSWISPDLTIDVTCSKGTYIRSLARDLGREVGTGAYLRALVRTASGTFTLQDSLSLDEVVRASALAYIPRLMYPLDVAFRGWPALFLTPEDVTLVRQGRIWRTVAGRGNQVAIAYAADSGRVVAFMRYVQAEAGWKPEKVFSEETDDVA
jgi:tRNA pseudouridine55 synthase